MTDDFTAFVRQTQADAFRLALALCGGDVHGAADLHQASLERVWARWRKLSLDSPHAYLRAVIVRTHATRRRRFSTSREHPTGQVPDLSVPGGQDFCAEAADLTQALARLPRRQRQAVVLRYLEDLSVAEVADLMGCTVGTVKRSAHDGLNALRTLLQTDRSPLTTAVPSSTPAREVTDA